MAGTQYLQTMGQEGWIIRADDGKERKVEDLEEAEQIREDLEDLGLEVTILSEDEIDNSETGPVVEGDDKSLTSDELVEVSERQDIVRPVDIEKILEMFEDYEDLKSELLVDEDIQKGDGGGRFIKKSGWRKIATAFNLDVEIIDHLREVSDGVIRYTVKARARAPNGKIATAIAMAQSSEPNFTEIVKWENKTDDVEREEFVEDPEIVRVEGAYRRLKPVKELNEHDIITLAATRAKNRAISDIVGGGELSAEEILK